MILERAPVQPKDEPFLRYLYASSRVEEMALVPWTEEQKDAFLTSQFQAQTSYYIEKYPQADFDVLIVDGARAGRYYEAVLDDQVRIIDLAVAPEFRGRGIESAVLEAAVARADALGLPVQVYLVANDQATGSYEELGFCPVDGGGPVYVLWRRPARSNGRRS